jgi:zinc transporter, ZIP family
MAESFGWGALGASSLILGGLLTMWLPIPRRVLGLIMAFGAGVLISAVAYELVEEAFDNGSGHGWVVAGLFVGSAVFFAGDWAIDRAGGEGGGMGLPITLGIVLDGIPESFVLGLTVLQGGTVSAAFLVAVFLSNLPEAIGATTGLLENGWSRTKVNALWVLVTVVSGLSALAGFALLDGASGDTIAFVLAFAAGAILTMLADSMMPEAFEKGGKLAGIVTTFGFAVAFAINVLE